MKKVLKQIFLIVLSFAFIFSCSCSKSDKDSRASSHGEKKKNFKVFVSILPQKFLVEAVCGNYVKVSVIASSGQKLQYYRLTPKQISELKECDYYVKCGIPFEKELVKKVLSINPKVKFINSVKGIDRMEKGEQGKKSVYSYAWLSPQIDRQMIKNIYEFFCEVDPEHFEYYRNEYGMASILFNGIEAHISEELAPYKGRPFIIFNPVLGHFAKDYELLQKVIEINEEIPLSKQYLKIIEGAKKENTKFIFVDPNNKTTIEILAKEIGCKVIVIDAFLENIPNNLLNISRSLKESFE